jgi:hypothetical protein
MKEQGCAETDGQKPKPLVPAAPFVGEPRPCLVSAC